MPDPDAVARRRFRWAVALAVLVGLGLQLWYAWAVRRTAGLAYDAPEYRGTARALANGWGLKSTNALTFQMIVAETAIHPPLTAMSLAIPYDLWTASVFVMQAFQSAMAGVTIVLIGLCGKELGGGRTGSIAAWLTALHPSVWQYPGILHSEAPLQLAVAGVLLLTYRFLRTPSLTGAAWLGGAATVAALVRSEQLLLLPLLVAPILWRTPGARSERFGRLLAAGGWSLALAMPWVLFNMMRFEETTTWVTGTDAVLAAANCDGAYDGDYAGFVVFFCRPDVSTPTQGRYLDESEQAVLMRRAALDYVGDHGGELPRVAVRRLGRTFGFIDPAGAARMEAEVEGREAWAVGAGVGAFWLCVLASIPGVRALRRDGRAVWPLASQLMITIIATALTFGSTRFRAGADLAVILVAAAGLAAMWGQRVVTRPPSTGITAPVT